MAVRMWGRYPTAAVCRRTVSRIRGISLLPGGETTDPGLRVGPTREWHGDFAKLLDHAAFDLRPRSRQAVVPLRPALGHPRLEPVGSVGHAVDGDRRQDLPIERRPVGRAAVALEGDEWPE